MKQRSNKRSTKKETVPSKKEIEGFIFMLKAHGISFFKNKDFELSFFEKQRTGVITAIGSQISFESDESDS